MDIQNQLSNPNNFIKEEIYSDEEINYEELYQHSNSPKVLKLMNKLLGKDPNAYFLKLAQSGAKLPKKFNM